MRRTKLKAVSRVRAGAVQKNQTKNGRGEKISCTASEFIQKFFLSRTLFENLIDEITNYRSTLRKFHPRAGIFFFFLHFYALKFVLTFSISTNLLQKCLPPISL
jgi:hypothetical protein